MAAEEGEGRESRVVAIDIDDSDRTFLRFMCIGMLLFRSVSFGSSIISFFVIFVMIVRVFLTKLCFETALFGKVEERGRGTEVTVRGMMVKA